jgi:glycine/D-amino acid oxidase-like deaminating enzyme
VCQYELTADSHFLFDRHPERDGWWLLGGGSGHGFKHGPEVGRYAAGRLLGSVKPEPRFSLASKAETHHREVH